MQFCVTYFQKHDKIKFLKFSHLIKVMIVSQYKPASELLNVTDYHLLNYLPRLFEMNKNFELVSHFIL